MQVRELMSTDVVTVPSDATVGDAVDRLLGSGVGSVIVVDDAGTPVGIVTEADALRAARERGTPFSDIAVSEVSHNAVVTTAPSRSVLTVARQMADEGVKKVPVVDGLDIVGVVTLTDIVWELSSLREEVTVVEALEDEWTAD